MTPDRRSDYSNRELDHFFTDVRGTLNRIEEQTTKTNGRVDSLEKTRIQVWSSMAVLLLVGGAIITLSVMAINSKIKEGIQEVLATYEISYEENR